MPSIRVKGTRDNKLFLSAPGRPVFQGGIAIHYFLVFLVRRGFAAFVHAFQIIVCHPGEHQFGDSIRVGIA